MRIIRKLFCHLHIEFTKILHFNPPLSITREKLLTEQNFAKNVYTSKILPFVDYSSMSVNAIDESFGIFSF